MYVNHLATWGFSKNYTEARVSNILHQKSQRNAVNKVSKFGEEGTRADNKKIEKYFARKKTSLETFISAEAEKDASMDAEVSSYTPLPEQHQSPQPVISHNEIPFSSPSADPDKVDQSLHEDYEENCPYRQGTQKFRLIEKFTEYYTIC